MIGTIYFIVHIDPLIILICVLWNRWFGSLVEIVYNIVVHQVSGLCFPQHQYHHHLETGVLCSFNIRILMDM